MENLEFKDFQVYNFYVTIDSEDYRYIEDFSEGMCATKHNNGVCGYIDKTGKETLLFEYKYIGNFKDGLALVQNKKGLYGFINKEFKEVINCRYTYAIDFKCGYSIVKINNHNFIINKLGEIIGNLEENINYEDFLKILYKKKLINKITFESSLKKNKTKDIEIVKKEYSIPFTSLKSYSYFDKNNERIIPYDNTENRDFYDDFVVVRLDRKDIRIFNKKGKQLKIHTCIEYDEGMGNDILELTKQFKYKVSNIEKICLGSSVTFENVEYVIYANDIVELDEKKIDVLNDIKENINNLSLINLLNEKIKKLTR